MTQREKEWIKDQRKIVRIAGHNIPPAVNMTFFGKLGLLT